MLDFFDGGNLRCASSCSLSLSENPGFPRFFDNWDKYFDKVTLRPLSIANAPEPIRRLRITSYNVCYTKLLRWDQARLRARLARCTP